MWRGGAVGALEWRSRGCRVRSLDRYNVTRQRQVVPRATACARVHQAVEIGTGKGWLHCEAGKVTDGLTENNGILLPGL